MKLEDLRNIVDQKDNKILSILIDRMKVSKAIGVMKKEMGIEIKDKSREQRVIDRLVSTSGEEWRPMVEELYEVIFKYSKMIQNNQPPVKK